jgi:hypothetical protein
MTCRDNPSLFQLFNSAFVLFDNRKKIVLKVLEKRDDCVRTGLVGFEDLRALYSWQTLL